MSVLATEEMSAVETGQMSSVVTGQMPAVETGQMSAAGTRQMCSIETGQSPVAIVDICPVSAADIKAWTAEAATAADQGSDGQFLACGGRDSGRPNSLHGAMDDPSLTAKRNRHRHM